MSFASIFWFAMGSLTTIVVIGVVYVSHQHYRIRKEDFNGYEADVSEYMLSGKM